jgi:hypothetical protein
LAIPLITLIYNKSLELGNPLILPKTCDAGKTKLGDLPSLKVQTKSVSNRTQGMQKEKDRTANPTLWDGYFFTLQTNQLTTTLDDARNPDLVYEQSQHLAAAQDNHTRISGEAAGYGAKKKGRTSSLTLRERTHAAASSELNSMCIRSYGSSALRQLSKASTSLYPPRKSRLTMCDRHGWMLPVRLLLP